MNRITYGICREEYSCNGHRRIAYGIVAYADAQKEGSACIVASVRDLSCDPESVEKLVDRCNRGGLCVGHLQDIAEDFSAGL